MIFGAILAGGTGSRMNNFNIPKQFIDLGGKPIIIRTIEKMLSVEKFDYLYIAIHPEFKNYLINLIEKFNLKSHKIVIVNGGKERINSVENILSEILQKSKNKDDIVIFHDAVRPFVNAEILENSIKTAIEKDICVAVIPAVDTMYILDEEKEISGFPLRKNLYNGQAPDSFKVWILKDAIDRLNEKERETITGTVQICAAKGYKVHTIAGSSRNIKITTNNDLIIAQAILKEEEKDESLCIRK